MDLRSDFGDKTPAQFSVKTGKTWVGDSVYFTVYFDNESEAIYRADISIEPDPDPLIGGAPVDGLPGWFFSDWFGFYNTDLAPWLFHAQHGFVYRDPGSTNESMFVYDDAMVVWWWTSEGNYPFIFAFDPPADNGGTDIGSEWLFYFEDSKTPRSFGVVTGAMADSLLSFGP